MSHLIDENTVKTSKYFGFIFLKNFTYFFERGRDSMSWGKGQRETEKQAPH